jgi:Tfp pilus assembly protein PilP
LLIRRHAKAKFTLCFSWRAFIYIKYSPDSERENFSLIDCRHVSVEILASENVERPAAKCLAERLEKRNVEALLLRGYVREV